jgi:hypothetical protein
MLLPLWDIRVTCKVKVDGRNTLIFIPDDCTRIMNYFLYVYMYYYCDATLTVKLTVNESFRRVRRSGGGN